ncbi:ABC transporter substrate-binding protein [Pannonibacter sp.]|uniref:ABC transporter substrate-binding protein n=1 Tax=Pannonibacter sp. TaxID=1906786 RepID=UPI003F71E18F
MMRALTLASALASALALTLTAGLNAAALAQQLNIHSATDTSAISNVVTRFEATNPGVQVVYTEYNTSELHSAVLANGGAGMDVVISSAMDLQVDLVNRGLARAFRPRDSAALPEWASWRDELWGFTFEPVVMAYNKPAFEGRDLPRTRLELASQIRDDPAFYNRRVGTYDVAVSGVGYLFATQDTRRGYQFPRLVETLGRAQALTYCCSSLILEALGEGRLVYGYNVIGSYALDIAARDPRIGLYLLDDYTLVLSRTAFVPRKAENPELGQRFIAYLLSREGQAEIARSGGLVPITALDTVSMPERVVDFLRGKPLFPIRLGPGLLTYLDRMKRARFLTDWSASFGQPDAPAP